MRRPYSIFLGCFLALSFMPAIVLAAGESIKDFNTEIIVNADGSLDVTEKIIYDFGGNSRHGIFRDITLSRETTDGVRSIRIANVSVTDETGSRLQFTQPYKSGYEEIKVGDPDILISGIKTYNIKYTVYGAVGYFNDYDEIYWNSTGNEWDVAIESASAQVILPKNFGSEELRISCYSGSHGSRGSCTKSETVKNNPAGEVSRVDFSSPALVPREGMTIAVGFPKGFVSLPSRFTAIMLFIYSYPLILLPLLTLIIMTYLWYKHGRDPKGAPVIVPEYNPPFDLTPLALAGILNQKVKDKDLSAEIIYLATKGFIKVNKIENADHGLGLDLLRAYLATKTFIKVNKGGDYRLDLLRSYSDTNGPDKLLKFDQMLLDGLFKKSKTVKVSDLENSFYEEVNPITDQVFSYLVSGGYYPQSPKDVFNRYFAGIIFMIFVASFIYGGDESMLSSLNFWFVGISFLIVYLFSHIMPKKTELGMKAHDKILGLKDYLQIAEKDRLKFNNAPERTPERFERLLPYAMVLGVEESWAQEFKDIYTQPPSWYSDTGNSQFNAIYFSRSLHDFSNRSAGAMSSSPSSSDSGSGGGGFSGGGGGGGGGGSW